MSKAFADLARYQGSSPAFFSALKSAYNCRGAIVQLTYGNYPQFVNPLGAYQVYNAYKAFGVVSAYHFYMGNPVAEANYFLKHVKQYGLDKSTLLAVDVEDGSLSGNITAQTNQFLDVLYNAGYHNLAVYSMKYWFDTKINIKNLHHNPKIWVASLGVEPKMKYDAWQYTWTGHADGSDVDLSIDKTGHFTSTEKAKQPTYWHKGSFFEAKSMLGLYSDIRLKGKRNPRFAPKSRFYAEVVKDGKVTRLKTHLGYVSANTAFSHRIK
ncbi:autolysin (plasmid) [Apilactobacillus apisilvae]|uniref:Autolysin n=1 Tax=Apilactobacillus apisilvae TaxID=2923364 RepID=A0ABY4PK18_9LACO|nr:GH25 family lysozyme [Apilactobacillus apisilvae]UQS85802.1 autolysin [Apilactobacillus apisilvae]